MTAFIFLNKKNLKHIETVHKNLQLSVCLVDYLKRDLICSAVSGGAVIPQTNLQQYCSFILS